MHVNALITVNAVSSGPSRVETWQGRDFRVVPAVLVRSQVLHNNLGRSLLPPEAFTEEWANIWNAVHVIAGDHPTKRGQHVSARDPEILNARGVGNIFNAKVEQIGEDGRHLAAEVWIDLARAEAVPELREILDQLDAGETVELSTGFPAIAEQAEGTYNSRPYEMILRPAGADHLAIFSELIGACSVNDGCGLGAGHVGNCSCGKKENAVEQNAQQVQPAEPAEEDTQRSKNFFQRMFEVMFKGGKLEAVEADNLENPSDHEWQMMLRDAIQNQLGGSNMDVAVADIFRDAQEVVFWWWTDAGPDPTGNEFYRARFEVSNEGEITIGEAERVLRRTTYEPTPQMAGQTATQEENDMNREQMLATLEEAGTERAALDALSDVQIEALHTLHTQAVENNAESATGQEVQNQSEAEGSGARKPEAGDAKVIETLLSQLAEQNEQLSAVNATLAEQAKVITELREGVAPVMAESERERNALVSTLSNNSRVMAVYSKEQIEGMTMEQLRQVKALSRGESYAAQGGPVLDAQQDEPQFMKPKPYFEKKETAQA